MDSMLEFLQNGGPWAICIVLGWVCLKLYLERNRVEREKDVLQEARLVDAKQYNEKIGKLVEDQLKALYPGGKNPEGG